MGSFDLDAVRLYLDRYELDFVAESPVVVHCHHFNLFWDQTVDDALGEDAGRAVRVKAAHKASARFLRGLVSATGTVEPMARLQLAREVFAAMGHGTLHLAVGRRGGLVRGEHLHYGLGWREKYGRTLKRSAPADAFAAGFSAAATEVAYELEPGTLSAHEERCIVDGSAVCNLRVQPGDGEPLLALGVSPKAARGVLRAPVPGIHEPQIEPLAARTRGFLSEVRGDTRGLISAFGVLVTTHLADYYNHAAHDVLAAISTAKPGGVEAFGELLREAGRACAVHTFGGVLVSPEWEAMVGVPAGDPLEVVVGCVALARAFGFGRWSIDAFEPGRRLVMCSPVTYESLFSRLVAGAGERLPGGIFMGAGVGIMQLAHAVTWQPRPQIDASLDRTLARESPWRVTVVRSFAAGDPDDCIEVTRA